MGRWWLAAIVVAVGAILAAVVALWPPDAEWPDTVPPDVLTRALQPQPGMPLSAQDTDVVLAIVCTLRRDRLEPYGHKGPTSPFLDRLSQHGVRFEHQYAQAPWTRPSVGSIVSGRWPRVLRLDNPGGDKTVNMVMSERHTLLAEDLKAAGYRTVGAVANPNAMARFGFAQGFDVYREPDQTYDQGHPSQDGAELVDAVLAQARQTPADQRLYARLLFTDTHQPRHFRPRLATLFLRDRQAWRYDASVRTVDTHLARLFTELRAIRPNTLFMVVADHGEGLRIPPHHGPGHGNKLYRSTIEVPFIVQHPGLPRPGRVIDGLSMNIDVLPTVLDLLGVPVEHPVDGVSEAPAVLGVTSTAAHQQVYAETYYRRSDKSTVIDDRWQLIKDRRRNDRRTLFASDDPLALRDEARSQRRTVRRMSTSLAGWERHIAALADESGQAEEVEVDPGTRRMLKALGYSD